MRQPRKLAMLAALATLVGCRRPYRPPEAPLPPNTVLLSQMLREFSAEPGFTDALLKQIDNGKKSTLMTPALLDELRNRILGKDWQGLNRFPGWTMREINPTVRVAGHYAGKDQKLEATSAVHPGTPLNAQTRDFLDLGPYALDKAETISLDKPSTLPPFNPGGSVEAGLVTTLGAGVTRGDGPNSFAPEHAESQRLANILNRLAANKLGGVAHFQVTLLTDTVDDNNPKFHKMDTVTVSTPEELIDMLDNGGHTVTVTDSRYFANFGHLHYKSQDVMMPFFVNTGLTIPNSGNRPLLVPVAHAEYEWHIRGPLLNADVSYYFGVDGKAEWRTMDTLDQSWVLHRDAHTYTGADALEVTRLAGLFTVAYLHLHAAHPAIPFGGYYAFGVCQDAVSAIERKLTGSVTLFPNTVDPAFFADPRDAEVNALIAAIPKDRDGAAPDPARIFGSLPVAPVPNNDFAAITIPGLAADLNTTYTAWQDNTLSPRHSPLRIIITAVGIGMLLLLLARRRSPR